MAHETILIVDDEPAIVQVISERLAREGFEVCSASDGRAALNAMRESPPDLVILDLMLPDQNGFEVLRQLRHGGHHLPVIILTARDDDVDIVVGLELGADDYMLKPFNPRELVARVRASLRRRAEALTLVGRVADLEARLDATTPSAGPVHDVPPFGLHFAPLSRQAWFEGQRLDLRAREYDLLYFLAQHRGQLLTRSALLDGVWGSSEYIDERTVDVHIHRLRHKLADIDPDAEVIQTERGVGYRLVR